MGFSSAAKKNKIMALAGKWKEMGNIMPSEIGQIQKIKGQVFKGKEKGRVAHHRDKGRSVMHKKGSQRQNTGPGRAGNVEWIFTHSVNIYTHVISNLSSCFSEHLF